MNRFDSDLLDQLVEFMLAPEGYPERLHRLKFPISTGGTLTANVSNLNETGQALATRALMAWTESTGLRFALVESDDAQIMFSDTESRPEYSARYKDGVIISSTVNIPADLVDDSEGRITTFAFDALIHEIGHALGLNHPAHYPSFIPPTYGEDNVYINDSWQTTAMSYFSQTRNTDLDASYARPVTPMIADIVALHDLYGTPVLRDGDTLYGVGSNVGGHLGLLLVDLTAGNLDGSVTFTLFDSGGIDTIDFSTDTEDQHVVLQPETASDVYGLVGNLVIARDTLIENYVAGSGDDRLVGNGADNVLEGSAGADDIDGQAGLDTAAYTGSDAAVTINLSDGTASGGDAEGDTLTSIENLTGSAYDDTLTGDAGANVLDGRAGADTLAGGDGSDTAAYAASDAAVMIDLSTGENSGGHAEGDTLTAIENLTGSAHVDALTGDAGSNVFDGRAGADALDGADGTDTAAYSHSDSAITIDLTNGTATGGHAEGDVITNIENLLGSRYADMLTGDAGANRLAGGLGNDRLEGRAGADALIGGSGSDTASYAASPAKVTVNLSDGATAGGDAEGDTLTAIENLTGSAHDDTLVGDAGDNVLEGGPGADTLDGGAGTDTADYSDAGGTGVRVSLMTGQGALGPAVDDSLDNIENLIGSAHKDILSGNHHANRLIGLAGNDRLVGNGGDDTLVGGPGADRLEGRAGNDTASWEGSGEAVTVRLHSLTATGGDAEGDTLTSIENLTGSDHNDILAGDSRVNVLFGGDGNDKLYGGPGGGDDYLSGEEGDDALYGGIGDDFLVGGPGADRLVGGPGADTLVGGAGADTLDGGAGTDTADYSDAGGTGIRVSLMTGQGARGPAVGDSLDNIENIVGSRYSDALTGDAGANRLDGGLGNDLLVGLAGADTLTGGAGTDTADYSNSDAAVTVNLSTGSAAGGHAAGDTLTDIENVTGSRFSDTLTGDAGANRLDGGEGDDVLTGGTGADIFVFGPGDGADTVTDFSRGTDTLDLTAFGIESVEEITRRMATGDDGITIDLTDFDGGSILLADLTTNPEAEDLWLS